MVFGKPAAHTAGGGGEIIQHLLVGHQAKIYYLLGAALAVAAIVYWGHLLPVFMAGLGDVDGNSMLHKRAVFIQMPVMEILHTASRNIFCR